MATDDVKTAVRTVALFELFAKKRRPLSLSEIARALNAPRSSCIYLVRSLERHGYLFGVGSQKQFYPTQRLYDLATSIISGGSWVTQIQPILEKLRDKTDETVLLTKRQDVRNMYLAVFEGSHPIRLTARVGYMAPLHSTPAGRAILSSLEPPALRELVATLPLEAKQRAALLKEVEKIAKAGVAITRGENDADIMAIAKAIVVGQDRFAVAIAGPRFRLRQKTEDYKRHLMAACDEIADVTS